MLPHFPSFLSYRLIPGLCLMTACFLSELSATEVGDSSEHTLSNAEGTLRFALSVQDGAASYRIDHIDGATTTHVLESSPLGFTRTDADFDRGLTFVSASKSKNVEENYRLIAGKQRQILSRGRERSFTLRNATGMTLILTVRAYRDGIAFRYGLPGAGSQSLYISDESTGFKLPSNSRVWTQPYMKVDDCAPSYEAEYVNGVPAGTPSPDEVGWSLPLFFQTRGLSALISESGLEPSYFGIHLQQHAPGGLYRTRLPEEGETYGVAPRHATITLPWLSPWRVVIVGRQPGVIAESTLVTDLARPSELADTSWIKPGVASWSWWSDTSSPSDYAKITPFIDASAKFHWRYSLIDLGWHQMKGGDIMQLVDYAAKKNVGLIVWYNSAGRHNKLPTCGPTDIMNDPLLRDAEFSRLVKLGIKGIKVDFMQSDKQFVIGLYHDILRDAARHKLLVNFHGATIPRGWDRTYPHLVSMEAVRGAEQYWDKNFAEQAQTFHSIYVFTRNAIGPMDYTPTVFTHPGPSNPGLQPHLTTHAHELALLVVFQSGIQHVIDPATSLLLLPAFVQEYLTDLPTAWDETRIIAGSPGELAVVARRSGRTWYLSGINGLKAAQVIQVPLAFLGEGRFSLSLITDGDAPHKFLHASRSANGSDVLEINLAGRGGFAARISRD